MTSAPFQVEIISSSHDRPFGIPRYDESLKQGLAEAKLNYRLVTPSLPRLVQWTHPFLSKIGVDLPSFLNSYPISVAPRPEPTTVKHFSNHTLASVLALHRYKNTVVTAHDIQADWLTFKGDLSSARRLMYRAAHKLSMKGLQRADFILTDTDHVKQQLINDLGRSEGTVFVVPLGVNHDTFRPGLATGPIRERLGLATDSLFILHVGTYAPRKNIPGLMTAFAKLREILPNVRLIKVGRPSWPMEFERVKQRVRDLALDEYVIFVDSVDDDELAALYNLSSLVIYPSFYEGFGLPVVEAMACGTPVVTSNASCLPEVAGDATILVDPTDVAQITDAMYLVLTQPALAATLRFKGIARAAQFTWGRTARETIAVYQRVLGESGA